MTAPVCPECGSAITEGGEPHEGQQITCTQCGARLEIINLAPFELDWFFCEPCYELDEV
jgi:lysine biosynthesis protein LysW